MSKRALKTCILCLRTDGGCDNREHVVQRFLSARWLLEPGVVCDRCNSATSVLDGDLKRYLATVLPQEERSVLGSSLVIVQIDGRWWAVRLRETSVEIYFPPQALVPTDPKQPIMLWAATEAEMGAVRRELEAGFKISIEPVYSLAAHLREHSLLVRSRPGKYQLLCGTETLERIAATMTLQLTASGFTVAADLRKGTRGELIGVRPVNISHVHRALTKVALNFLAHMVDEEVARSAVLFPLRLFVLNNKEHRTCLINAETIRRTATESNRSVGLCIAETLFERSGPDAERLAGELVQPGKHVFLVAATSRGLSLFVSLYGEPIAFVPILPPLPGATISGILAGAVVDPRAAKADELVRLPQEDRDALVELFRHWSSSLLAQQVPVPNPTFEPSEALPFEFSAVCHPHGPASSPDGA